MALKKQKKETLVKKIKSAKTNEELLELYKPIVMEIIRNYLIDKEFLIISLVPTKIHILIFHSQYDRAIKTMVNAFEDSGFPKMTEDLLLKLVRIVKEPDGFLIKKR